MACRLTYLCVGDIVDTMAVGEGMLDVGSRLRSDVEVLAQRHFLNEIALRCRWTCKSTLNRA